MARRHVRVSTVCPITGVTVVDVEDKLTLVIHFADAATPEQRTVAQRIVTGFEVTAAESQIAQRAARLAADQQELSDSRLDAAITALIDATPAQRVAWASNSFPTLTPAERARIGMIMNMIAVSMRPQIRG